MSVMLPQDLVFVLNLIGFNWPQADEDKLKESARHWREYASELEYVIADSTRILDQVQAENSGEAVDALELHWQQFGEHLRQAHQAAGVVAEVLDGFALVVEGLKAAVLVQLGILAAELAATTGAAFLTFGVAEAAAPEEIVISQGVMRWLSREAIQKAERLVAEKIAKTVTEKFLSIKNGLKALKASPAVLKDFGKGLVSGGGKELKNVPGPVKGEGSELVKGVTPAYRYKLAPADVPRSRSVHFNRANAGLDDALKSDPAVVAELKDSVGVQDRVSSVGGRKNPLGYVWHHATTDQAGGAGELDLVSKAQHTPGSPEWDLLHPDGKGGYSEWAIPAGAPKN